MTSTGQVAASVWCLLTVLWRCVDAQCTVNSIVAPTSSSLTVEQLEGHWLVMRLYGDQNQIGYSSYSVDWVSTLDGITQYVSSKNKSAMLCDYVANTFQVTSHPARFVSSASQGVSVKTLLIAAADGVGQALLYYCQGNVTETNACSNPVVWVQSRQANITAAVTWVQSLTQFQCFNVMSGENVVNNETEQCPFKPFWGLSGRDCRVETFAVQENFNLTKYMGLWREMAWLAPFYIPESSLFQDYRHTYVLLPGDNVTAYVAGRDPSKENDQCFFYTLSYWQTGVPGKMKFNDSTVSGEYNVMLTDYDHYAVVYGCNNRTSNGQCQGGRSWIWSRDVTLSRQYRLLANTKLQQLCLNPSAFLATEQNNDCGQETQATVETTTSAAEVTTSHGHHDITCTESRMEFSIPLSSPHTSETATLSDPNCQINVTRTHVRGGVDLNSCGTTVQFQNDSVIFRNAIIFSAPESSSLGSSGSNSSVSQYQDIIPIQCVYNRIATVHLSYMPVVRRVLFTESGVGQFSFNIQQFWDASFTNMVSDRAYPLRMELDADVFIQLSVGSEGQPVAGHKEIGMEVQQCLVSPSSSVIEAQLHYYPLIQDGCPASSDVHIIPNTNASDSTVMRFRFRAVNFFDPSSSSTSSLVFVHCRMGLCLTGSCKPSAWSCLTPPARRVRRDVDQSKRAAHQLSTGPFLIMADEASTSSSSTTATVMAVVSTSVATVAIVIAAIALIALRRRRTTERN